MSNDNLDLTVSNHTLSGVGLRTRRAGSIFTGVCSGIAEFLRVDVGIVRVCVTLGSFYSGWVLPAYITLAFVLPNDSRMDPKEAPPFLDGQKVISELKKGGRALMKAMQTGDGQVFRRAWDEQLVSCRRAWVEAIKR
jgi:phage shock protein PspC (stress-responsive transcriptional regulator)